MLGQMTTELKCRALLSLQQLYAAENTKLSSLLGVKGWSERDELILTDLVNIPRDTPAPPLCSSSSPPVAFLRPLSPGHEWMAWVHQREARPTSRSSDNDTTQILYWVSRGVINKNPGNSLAHLSSLYIQLPFAFSFLKSSPSFLRKKAFTDATRCTQKSLMLNLIVPFPAAQ